MSNPDEIRRDIDRTRAELSDNVNALGDRSNPSNIARSQVDKVKDGAHNLKERIFGSDYDPYDDGAVGEISDRAHMAASDAKQAVSDAPDSVRRRTRGNPLAAGLIAAGIGALVGGLIPASRREQELAERVKDKAEPAVEELKQMAMQAKEHLQPQAEQAADEVKHVAQGAAETVKIDAQVAADEVKCEAQDAVDHVRDEAQGAVDDTKRDVQDIQQEENR